MPFQKVFLLLITSLLFQSVKAQVTVSFTSTDTTQVYLLSFVNGVTSDSVFSCICHTGSFIVPDANFCPTVTLDTKSEQHDYDFVYISMDQPFIQFDISWNDGLPMLQYKSDTFNQYYFNYANTLRPIKWHQRQLHKAMRDTTNNVDSLYKVWLRSSEEFSRLQSTFYAEHGHRSRARLMYLYSKLASKSMAHDTIRALLDDMQGYGSTMKQYDYCKKMLTDTGYIIAEYNRMPSMVFKNASDEILNTNSLLKGKVNYFFWASWCRGCKPELEMLQKSATKEKWVIVSVDRDFNQWKNYIADNDFLRHTFYYNFADIDETLFRIGVNYLPYIIETSDGLIIRKGAEIQQVLKDKK